MAETDLAERLMRIGRDSGARLTEPWQSVDHGDLLYDDAGMPPDGDPEPTSGP